MKLIFAFLTVLALFLLVSCKKDPDRIDAFVSERTGTYVENECGTGGPITGSISLEDAKLSITNTGAESAQIICHHAVAGELFRCSANIQTDSTLIIPAFQLDGKTYDGLYIIRAAGIINLYLYLPDIECTTSSTRSGNIAWITIL